LNQFPVMSISGEEKERRFSQLYLLMEKQVNSYHAQRRMGSNSSVTVELAQELLTSMVYTLEQVGGMENNENVEAGLRLGQQVLESKLSQAEQLLRLVEATAPSWQEECRWEVLTSMRRYLQEYDWKHLAHRQPDDIFYPFLAEIPESMRGIDYAVCILRMLWLENQIIAVFQEDALEQFWDALCQNDRGITENQCEQLLINGIGKILLSANLTFLLFTEQELRELAITLQGYSRDELETALYQTVSDMLLMLKLKDGNVAAYIQSLIPQLLPRLEVAIMGGNLYAVFLCE